MNAAERTQKSCCARNPRACKWAFWIASILLGIGCIVSMASSGAGKAVDGKVVSVILDWGSPTAIIASVCGGLSAFCGIGAVSSSIVEWKKAEHEESKHTKKKGWMTFYNVFIFATLMTAVSLAIFGSYCGVIELKAEFLDNGIFANLFSALSIPTILGLSSIGLLIPLFIVDCTTRTEKAFEPLIIDFEKGDMDILGPRWSIPKIDGTKSSDEPEALTEEEEKILKRYVSFSYSMILSILWSGNSTSSGNPKVHKVQDLKAIELFKENKKDDFIHQIMTSEQMTIQARNTLDETGVTDNLKVHLKKQLELAYDKAGGNMKAFVEQLKYRGENGTEQLHDSQKNDWKAELAKIKEAKEAKLMLLQETQEANLAVKEKVQKPQSKEKRKRKNISALKKLKEAGLSLTLKK